MIFRTNGIFISWAMLETSYSSENLCYNHFLRIKSPLYEIRSKV